MDEADCISDESSFYGDDDLKNLLESSGRVNVKRKYSSVTSSINEIVAKHRQNCSPDDRLSKCQPGSFQSPPISDIKPHSPIETEQLQDQEAGPVVRTHGSATRSTAESIHDFLTRLPVASPVSAQVGPWLWVHNAEPLKQYPKEDIIESIDSFVASGKRLLASFSARGNDNARSRQDIGVNAEFRALERELLLAAMEAGVTNGKWMLFPDPPSLPHYWSLVAQATADGKLGPTSKVATSSPTGGPTLICVYTEDFADTEDVKRVLKMLVELRLCSTKGRPIYYKCDAYTYLNIDSKNPYKLRASLYSSIDFLKPNSHVLSNGTVAMLNRTLRKAG